MKIKNHKITNDAQLHEFETQDLGKDIKKLTMIKPHKVSTSIVLDTGLVGQLRAKAKKRHIGYQTMMKIIVAENLARY